MGKSISAMMIFFSVTIILEVKDTESISGGYITDTVRHFLVYETKCFEACIPRCDEYSLTPLKYRCLGMCILHCAIKPDQFDLHDYYCTLGCMHMDSMITTHLGSPGIYINFLFLCLLKVNPLLFIKIIIITKNTFLVTNLNYCYKNKLLVMKILNLSLMTLLISIYIYFLI